MSAASDYLSQQITLAASKAPIVTFVSCQRSLAPSVPSHEDGIGLATFGWGINGHVITDAAGQPNGLHFGQVYQWFSDRFTPSSTDLPPDLQYFRGGSGLPRHDNRDSLSLTFRLATIQRLQLGPISKPDSVSRSSGSLSGSGGGSLFTRITTGDTVVDLEVALQSWSTGTGATSAPTWTVSTSMVDGPSQQLVFNIPGSFQIPGAASAPHGAAPAVMLISFNNQGEYGWL